jgi:hypothetical protein
MPTGKNLVLAVTTAAATVILLAAVLGLVVGKLAL